jgi:hypothetical protein
MPLRNQSLPIHPPAIVKAAEDLPALARIANEENQAGEASDKERLDHYKKAGEALAKAKKQCGHGRWKQWVDDNIKFSYRMVMKYMQFAKVAVDGNYEDMKAEWKRIQGNLEPEEDEPEQDAPADQAPAEADGETARFPPVPPYHADLPDDATEEEEVEEEEVETADDEAEDEAEDGDQAPDDEADDGNEETEVEDGEEAPEDEVDPVV